MLSVEYSLQGVQLSLLDGLLCEMEGPSDQVVNLYLDLVMIVGQAFHLLFAVQFFELSLLLCRIFSLLLSKGQLLFQSLQLDVFAHNRLLSQLDALALCLKLLNKEVNLIQLTLKLRVSFEEFVPPFEEKQKEVLLLLLVPPCSLLVISIIAAPIFSGELGQIDHAITDHQCQNFFAVLLLLVCASEVPPFRVDVVQLLLLSIVSLDQVIQLPLQFASFPFENLQFLELILVLFAYTFAVSLAVSDAVSHRIDLLRKRLLEILEKRGHSLHSGGRLPPLIHKLRAIELQSLDVAGQLAIFDCYREDILEQFVIEVPVGVERAGEGVVLSQVGGPDDVGRGLFGC